MINVSEEKCNTRVLVERKKETDVKSSRCISVSCFIIVAIINKTLVLHVLVNVLRFLNRNMEHSMLNYFAIKKRILKYFNFRFYFFLLVVLLQTIIKGQNFMHFKKMHLNLLH